MSAVRVASASLLLVMLPLWSSCAVAPSVAGSVIVPAGAKRTLHVTAVAGEPRDMRMHLWSRGPGVVLFTPIAPLPHEPGTSPLQPKSGDFRWQITAKALAIELGGGTEDATVGYELHANGKVAVDVEYPDSPHTAPTAPAAPDRTVPR